MFKPFYTWIFCSLGLLMLLPGVSRAGKEGVENVRFEVQDEKIVVFYDLWGEETYNVTLQVSTDAGRSFTSPSDKYLSGDFGPRIHPGEDKEIVWDVLKNLYSLKSQGLVFEVRAVRPRKRKLWPWLAGAGILGAVVGIGVIQDNGGPGTIIIDVPNPPNPEE